MRFSILVLLLLSLSRGLAAAQDARSTADADPSTVLGLTEAQFHQIFPDKCKKAHTLCRIKRHTKEMFGASLATESVQFVDGAVYEVKLTFKGGPLDGLERKYGRPESPSETRNMEYDPIDDTLSTINGDEITVIGEGGASKTHLLMWFKPGYTISYAIGRRRSFIDDSVSGSLGVEFRSSGPSKPPPPSAVDAAKKTLGLEGIKGNSEAASASPAAANTAATLGHIVTPQEAAELVKKGQASVVVVLTTPPGAEIDVDGNKLGVSPLVFNLLRLGDSARTLTIKLAGYKAVEKKVLPDGKKVPIGLALEKE